jgi:surface antigen Omp85-like protein
VSWRRAALAGLLSIFAGLPLRLPAQTTEAVTSRTTLAAGERYRAGWFHRLLLGSHYRRLWAAPISVEVLSLTTYAGGLAPERCGGGLQTHSLRLLGADGRAYVFRSVDKDAALSLPPDLRHTFPADVLQDQISASHPGAPLVVAPLLQAAGVLHATPRLVVLPEDPRLASFACVQPGILGMLEEQPRGGTEEDQGFAGAVEVIGTPKLFDHLENRSTHRVDRAAFLKARLLDVYVGDWDRHRDQWRWARYDSIGSHWWKPIPRDRDQAFVRFDGGLLWLARSYFPKIVVFSNGYSNLYGLTLSGETLDRRLLSEVERPAWDSIAADLQRRLTDAVIDSAVRQLPAEYYRVDGAALTRALRRRRDHLPQVARHFYHQLAGTVDVHATDAADLAEVERLDGGHLTLRLTSRATPDAGAYYQRTFLRRETSEIRLYLHGGDDRLAVRGTAGGPTLRVIGGGGTDELVDSARGGATRFYDDRSGNRLVTGPGTSVDTRPYEQAPVDTYTLGRPRDWGARTVPLAWLSAEPDLGLFVGGGFVRTRYGFRHLPYHTRLLLRAGYATGAASYRAELLEEVRDFPGPATTTLHLRASGIEIVRFYGFGNESPGTGSTRFHKVPQEQYLIAPTITWPLSIRSRVSIGLVAKDAESTPDTTRLIGLVRHYGIGSFQQVGATGGLRVDTRDLPAWATHGVLFTISGSAYPAALDVLRAFGAVTAQAATYLTVPHGPTLALRVAGSRVFGPYPFHEAAFVGGGSTVRGYAEHRFAGDAALMGNAELRVSLTRFTALLPTEFGVFGLADAGRVFLSGETSTVWHGAAGGGLWFAFLNRVNTLTVALARSPEHTGLYVRAGFAY